MRAVADPLYLAVRYLRASPWRSLVLILGTTVALFLPVFTWLAAQTLETALLARAEASPVLIGAKGNEFDLTMASLYFRGEVAETLPYGERGRLADREGCTAVPLHVRHRAGGAPIVGTSPAYYRARGLTPAEGRLPALLGEVVAGAEVARKAALSPGERVRSDMSNLYNLAGAYPLLLDVVGILEPTGGPDDDAFFADVKTAWALDGLFHGHGEVTAENALDDPDRETGEDDHLEASAAIFLFAEINDRNRGGFHFHGELDDAPLTSVLVLPADPKAHDLLLGDYALSERYRAVRPVEVVETILDIVLRLKDALTAYFALVAASTAAFFALVLALSLRLRRQEIRLMVRMGASRFVLAAVVGAEILLVLGTSIVLTALFTWGGLAALGAVLRT